MPAMPVATFRAEHPFRPTHPLGFTNTCSPSRTLRAGPSLAASRPVAGRLWIGSTAVRPRPARIARRGTRAGGVRSSHAPSATLAPSSCWTNRPPVRRARPARATAPRYRRIHTVSRCARSTGRAGPVRARRATTTVSHRSDPIARRASPAGPCADAAIAAEHPPTAGVPAARLGRWPPTRSEPVAHRSHTVVRSVGQSRRESPGTDFTNSMWRRRPSGHAGRIRRSALQPRTRPSPSSRSTLRRSLTPRAPHARASHAQAAHAPGLLMAAHAPGLLMAAHAPGLGGSSPFPARTRPPNATSRPIGRLV